MRNSAYPGLISAVVGLILTLFSELTILEIGAISFSCFTFLLFILRLGYSFVVKELMALIATTQILLASTLTYIQRPENMPLPSEDYLNYALPATISFCFGLLVPIFKTIDHSEHINKIRDYLSNKKETSITLLALGIIGTVLVKFMPVEIRAIVNLFGVCLYASVLYGYYSRSKYKYLTLAIALLSTLYSTIAEGMFGTLLYYTSLTTIIILVGTTWGKQVSTKVGMLATVFFFILLTQSIKMEYRKNTWGSNITERKGDANLMMSLVENRLNDSETLFGSDHLFATYNRLNQGILVSHAMEYVPIYEPFANGELLLHFFYPFIPRFLWNDKPITGGEANISRFTKFPLTKTSSFNISPIGEGYVNFGRLGGVLFMLLFGLLFNYTFSKILTVSQQTPSVILWIPCLFSGCLTMETDVLTNWGSLVTMAIFLITLWPLLKKVNVKL